MLIKIRAVLMIKWYNFELSANGSSQLDYQRK